MQINYQKELDKLIQTLTEGDKHPTLLLHSCCAPCSSYVLEYLSSIFDITVFYYNPNIYPQEEYEFRAKEQKRLVDEIKTLRKISFMEGNFDSGRFYKTVQGLENEPENGARCLKCYELRLWETAQIAKQYDFDYFTTTLSISPLKNAQKINAIGQKIEQEVGVKYLYADFKKKEGYKRSIELSKEYNLYRQKYCGCIFSLNK